MLPVMETIRPGFKEAAARSVELVRQSALILKEVAQEDLERIKTNEYCIAISGLLKLSEPRQALVVRRWIEGFGLQAPSKAKLDDLLKQVRSTGHDTRLTVRVGNNKQIRRYSDLLVMFETAGQKKDMTRFETLTWKGPGHYSLPGWGGELIISEVGPGEAGVAESYFTEAPLQVRPRQGGEKLKLYRNRPRKHLKDLYQKAGIAEFDRTKLPLLWSAEDLIFAAGLGMDVRYETEDETVKRYRIEFKADATLLTLMGQQF